MEVRFKPSNHLQGCEKEIGQLKAMVNCCEKDIQELCFLKNMDVCGLIMFVAKLFIFIFA